MFFSIDCSLSQCSQKSLLCQSNSQLRLQERALDAYNRLKGINKSDLVYMTKLQPEANGSNTEVHSQWQQQEVPSYGSFSSPGYPSQIPMNFKSKEKLITNTVFCNFNF